MKNLKTKLLIFFACVFSFAVFAAVKTTFYGPIDMQNNRINNVGNPSSSKDAATKGYVDGTFLPIQGTSASSHQHMEGSIHMGGYRISHLAMPTNSADGASKEYVDTMLSSYLSLSGGHMNGQVDMGGYRIYNLANPIGNQDAVPKSYVDSVINNANAYQYFALKKGSGFTPIYNLDSNTDRWFDVKVVRQFTGAITSYYENIRAVATPNFPNKTWKVGETVKVLFSLGPDTFTQTNGTLVVKGGSGVLGNFGITAPPNGITPFTCSVIINGNEYANDTSVDIQGNGWDSLNRRFDFKIKNTSGRTISGATITAPIVFQYTSPSTYSAVSLNWVDAGTTISPPDTITISTWANNMELTFRLTIMDFDIDKGLRWNFTITGDGETYNFGQFFYYIP